MDRTQDGDRSRWAWLPQSMPGVAKLIEEKKRELGRAHVAQCWQRGVIERQPGWFFAREGALAIGAPWDDPVMANFAAQSVTATQALLILRPPEANDGQD